jgi:hypothetical protein
MNYALRASFGLLLFVLVSPNHLIAQAPTSPGEVEKVLFGKNWKAVSGTEWAFRKDGTGKVKIEDQKPTDFKWTADPTGLIKVDGVGSKGQPVTWYVRLESARKGSYGSAPDKVDRILEATSPRVIR